MARTGRHTDAHTLVLGMYLLKSKFPVLNVFCSKFISFQYSTTWMLCYTTLPATTDIPYLVVKQTPSGRTENGSPCFTWLLPNLSFTFFNRHILNVVFVYARGISLSQTPIPKSRPTFGMWVLNLKFAWINHFLKQFRGTSKSMCAESYNNIIPSAEDNVKDTVRQNQCNPSGARLGLGWHQTELRRVMVWDVMEGERN